MSLIFDFLEGQNNFYPFEPIVTIPNYFLITYLNNLDIKIF